jgi:hypothetical protein
MSKVLNLSTKLHDKKLKHSGLSSTACDFDLALLNQYLNVCIIGLHGQEVSKSSRRYCVLKSFIQVCWFRLNQPVSVTTLVAETSEPSGFVLRLLRKGVERGRYVRSRTEYLPSFEAADAMAGWFQQASIPFTLQVNQFLIKTELPSSR